VVEELADGLEETYRLYLGLGLTPEAAAAAAVTEFGEPDLVAAEFARAPSPPGRPQASDDRAGSGVVLGRAWDWPVPPAARVVPGVALVAVVALLAVAARSIRYRSVGRAGAAGCVGTAALDAFMIIGVLAADPAARWAVAVAVTASATQLGLNARLLRLSRPFFGGFLLGLLIELCYSFVDTRVLPSPSSVRRSPVLRVWATGDPTSYRQGGFWTRMPTGSESSVRDGPA
jgi:hypothetical protein